MIGRSQMGIFGKEELQPIDGIEVIGGMTFADKLQKYLDASGRKPADIARDAGVSPGQISKYRSGETKPSVPVILRLSRTTGIALEYWLDEEMTEPPREELTADEARLLWVIRALGLDAEEALRRLDRGKGTSTAPKPPNAPNKPDVTQTSKDREGSSPKRGAR